MNKKQYNNIIEHSLQYDCNEAQTSLDTARTVFNNMGVALPNGTQKEVFDTISTNEYMGWRKCTLEEAKEAANNGTAAIGISEDKIVILSAEDEEQPAPQTASVLTLTDTTPAISVANLQYYAYSYGTTGGGTTIPLRKAIIIIPGIMGSELFAGEQIDNFSYGTKLWDPSVGLDADDKIKKLACTSNGNSIYNIYAGNQNFGARSLYKRIYNRLSSIFDNSYDVLYFPYDWRQSCTAAAQDLNSYINGLNYDKVILVAHSMGGIVAACYLAMGVYQRNKVDKFIALGTPFFGATELIRVYNQGLDLGFLPGLIVNDDIKDIMPNIKSVYELLPCQKWFDYSNKKVFKYTKLYTVPGYEDDGETFISQTYADTKNRLYKKLDNSNSSLLSQAESMHSNLFLNGQHITNYVDSYYVVGTNEETVVGIEATVSGETGALETIGYTRTNEGDGTVPKWSANLGNLYPSKTYYATGRDHCGEYDFDNNTVEQEGLAVSENIIQLIKNIINNNSSLPSGISRN